MLEKDIVYPYSCVLFQEKLLKSVRGKGQCFYLLTNIIYHWWKKLHVKLQAFNFVQKIHSFFRYMYSFISDMITF